MNSDCFEHLVSSSRRGAKWRRKHVPRQKSIEKDTESDSLAFLLRRPRFFVCSIWLSELLRSVVLSDANVGNNHFGTRPC